jgi:hypothetical protein
MPRKQWDIPQLLTDIDSFYANLPAPVVAKAKAEGKPYDKIGITRERIIALRKWEASRSLIQPAFDQILKELEIVYVPKSLSPGPAVIFPIIDVDREAKYAQTKPLEGSELSGDGKFKYNYIGTEPIGPRWINNTEKTLQIIINTGKLIVVEGPFDLLACRLLMPDAPIMTPLTKTLGQDHVAYMRIFGVKELYLMYDNDKPDIAKGHKIGQGHKAMLSQMAEISRVSERDIHVNSLYCPTQDPSKALERPKDALELKEVLASAFRTAKSEE